MKNIRKLLISVLLSSLLLSFDVSASAGVRTTERTVNRFESQDLQDFSRDIEKQFPMQRQQMLPAETKNDSGFVEMLPPPQTNGNLNPSIDQPQIDSEMQHQLQEQNQSAISDEEYIEVLGNVTQEQYDTFDLYLDMVDANLLQSFIEKGWEIILTDADLDELLFKGTTEGVMGCTYFGEKTIYIAAGDYSYCIIHEMGHYLDFYYDFASDTEEFEAIYEDEAVNLSEYGQTSSEEFLAEIYMYAIMEPETTIQSCPQAVNYVDDLVENVA